MSEYRKAGFTKNSLAYSSTKIASQFIAFAREFLVRRILPPEIMGFWNFTKVVQGIIAAFDLGCIAGANRELPIMLGSGEQREQSRIRSTTFWFTLIQNIVVGAFGLSYVWWNGGDYLLWERIAGCVGILIFIILSFQNAYMCFFASAQEFVLLSRILFLGTITEGVTFPLCAYVWGLPGIMVMGVIASGLRAGLFVFNARVLNLHVRFRIFRSTLKRLLSFGFFLRLVDFPNVFFGMASTLWVTKFMGIEALALFSMAKSFFLQIVDISGKVCEVYSMRFLKQAGSGVPGPVIAKQMKQFMLFQLLVMVPLLTWAAGVVLPFIVNNFIPRYSAANQALLILLTCGFFYVGNTGLTMPWVLEKRLIARGTSNVFGLGAMITALAVQWYVFGDQSINGAAYATLAGYFFYFLYMVLGVGKDLWLLYESGEIILTVTVAAGWTFFLLYTGQASQVEQAPFTESLKDTLFMGLWTFGALLPVPLYGLKRSRILKGWQQ